MKSLWYHPKASDEIDNAYIWYAMRSAQAADGFYEDFYPAVTRLRRQPDLFPPYLHGTRRVILETYPYFIVFRELPRKIQIIAIAHARRKPAYWANRL